MTAVPAAAFEAQRTERQIQVVVDNDHLIAFVKLFYRSNRTAGMVHISEGFQKKKRGTLVEITLECAFDDGVASMPPKQFVDHHKTDVMAGRFISRTRVAQSDDQQNYFALMILRTETRSASVKVQFSDFSRSRIRMESPRSNGATSIVISLGI